MTQSERDRATITALKIALEQAADLIQEEVDREGNWSPEAAAWLAGQIDRYLAMTAEGWDALPVEITGPGGES